MRWRCGLIGLNHGILIGLAAGLISFIPYLGSLTGLVLSLCVVVLQFWPSWTLIPVVLGIFLAGQAIADYVLAPYLIASRVHLNPVWVMFAIAAFGYLFGFVGLLIAVPLAAAIGVVFRFATRQHLFNPPEAAHVPAPAPLPQEALSPAQELAEGGLPINRCYCFTFRAVQISCRPFSNRHFKVKHSGN